MKRLLIPVLLILCLATFAFGQVNTDLKGTITCWTWTAKAIQFVTPEFQKLYPNINVDVTPMSHPDTHDKIFVAIASGSARRTCSPSTPPTSRSSSSRAGSST